MNPDTNDVFRLNYTTVSDENKMKIAAIKVQAQGLYDLISDNSEADLRMLALAKTKLEESIMWAVKGITK